MKKLLICILLSPLTLFAQPFTYIIKGKVADYSAKVYLTYTKQSKPVVDSTWMKNGDFEFNGSSNQPVYARITIDRARAGLYKVGPGYRRTLYLEPGTVTISSPDSLTNAQVTGGVLNADNNRLISMLRPFREKMDRVYINKGSMQESMDAKAAYDHAGLAFIKENPSSPVSLDFLQNYGGQAPEYSIVAPIYDLLSDPLKNTPAGKAYAAKLDRLKHTAIGSEAPDFAQADTAGKIIWLHDYKGKYILVDFWASWCGPCRKENPNLVAAYHRYKGKGFNVLGVSLDRDGAKAAWIKAIKDDGLEWTQVSDLKFWDNEVARKFNIQSIPQNFLISPDGKIVAKNLRGDGLNEKLDEIFGHM